MKHKLFKYYLLLAVLVILTACSSNSTQLEISNPNNFAVQNAGLTVQLNKLDIPEHFTLTKGNGDSIPYQLDDLDGDGSKDVLFFQISMESNSDITLRINEVDSDPEFKSKTDAVFKIRDEADPANMQVGDDFRSVLTYRETSDLKQDNGLIFLEGPGWESNLVGYRFYFDDRNRFDVFGKSTTELSLGNITEEYHSRRAWGADILKVGTTLGIGSPALFKDGSFHAIEKTGLKSLDIITNGPLRSIIRVKYPEWEVDGDVLNATMELEIHANHRYTELRLSTDGTDQVFATGLVDHPAIEGIVESVKQDYTTAYTWGNQTDMDEVLGMALIFPASDKPVFEGLLNDTYTYSINSGSRCSYRFLAAWELEPEEIRINSEEEFDSYVQQVAKQWTNPLQLTIIQ
jgi:hypothetical protein